LVQQNELFQKNILGSGVNEVFRLQFERWQTTINRVCALQNLTSTIPEVIYPRLEDLASVFNDTLPIEEQDDLESSITVIQPEVQQAPDKWTWDRLVVFILAILTFLYPIYHDYQEGIQHENELKMQEKQHEELVHKLDEFIEFITPLIPQNRNDPEVDPSSSENLE
jgi:hypothetical protein